MKDVNKTKQDILRQKAENLHKKKLVHGAQVQSGAELSKLVHELEVHQIELELQNEELVLSRTIEKLTTEKYQNLYDFAPSGYFVLSTEGTILELNIAGAALLGKERNYLKNKRFALFIAQESKPAFSQFFEKVFKSDKKLVSDVTFVPSNESKVYTHITGMVTENKEQCLLSVVDISKRKQAENNLKEFKELFSKFMQHSPVYTFIKEVSETGIRVLQASDNFQEMIGVSGQEMIGKTMEELFPPEFAVKIKADDLDVVNKGEVLQLDEEFNNRYYTTIKFPILMGDKKLLAGYTIDITERKQAEDALAESRDLLKSIIENAPIRVFWKDTELRYLGANSIFAQDAGMSGPEEMIGKDDFQMGWSEQAELYRADDQYVIDSGQSRIGYEEPQTTPDGREILLRTSKVPLRDVNRKIIGILGVYDDITAQKKAEKAIIKIKNELKSALESMSDAVFISDVHGNFVNYNEAFISFYRFKDKEAYFEALKDWTKIIEVYNLDGSVLPLDRWVVNRAINGETVSGEEYILERKDTGERWYGNYNYAPIRDDKGMIIGSVVVARDVTDRVQSEQDLKDSEEKYRSLVEGSLQGMVVALNNPKRIAYASSPMETISGYSVKEIESFGPEELTGLVHPDDRGPFFKAFADRLSGKDFEPGGSYRLIHKDGSVRWVDLYSTLIQYNNEPATQTAFLDVTERKKAEAELKSIEWLLQPKEKTRLPESPGYGDLTALNTERTILDAVGKDVLNGIVSDYLALLETSAAVYEKNGDYAFGIFSSDWCQFMDCASRALCKSKDNKKALESGEWLCHESCWADASKQSMQTNKPVDIECSGGLRMYALPITANNEIVGSINFGYGDPPTDENKLEEIATNYKVPVDKLKEIAQNYETRPAFIIDIAKEKLESSARLIGNMVERKFAEEALSNSEERYRGLIDNLGAGVIVHAADTAILINNEQASNLLGLSSKQLKGKKAIDPDWHFTDEHSNKLPIESYPVHIISESKKPIKDHVLGVYRPATKDQVWLMVNGYPITDDADHITEIVISFIDFTARKQAAEDLLQSEKRLRTILDTSPFPTAVSDTNAEQISYWSKSAIQLFGYQPKTVKEWYQLAYPDPDYRQEVINQWNPFLEIARESVEAVNTGEYQIVCKDGSVKICEIFVQFIPGNLIVTFHDITEKKHVENDLRESEERYRNLLENVSAGIGYYDLEGNILLFNKLAASNMKSVPEDFIGKTIFEVFGKDLGKLYFDRIQSAAEATRFMEFEDKVTLPAGTQWFISRYSKIYNAEGAVIGVQVVSHDITELKNAENSAIESEIRFKALHNATFGGITIHDKGMILDCNQGLSDTTGYKENELIGMDALQLFAEESREMVKGHILAEYEEAYEAIGLKKNGEKYPVQIAAKMIPYKGKKVRVAEFRDITEQKQAEETIKLAQAKAEESERYIENIINNIGDPVFVKDDESKLILVNDAFCKLFKRSRANIIGKTLAKDVPPEESEQFLKIDKQVISSGKDITKEESITVRGEKMGIFTTRKTRYIDLDNRKYIIGITHDITERKKVEENLQYLSSRNEALLDAVPDIIMEVDHNKVYTWANKAGIEFFGDDVIGKEAAFYFDGEQDTYEMVAPLFGGAKNIIYVESWQRRKDGVKRLLAWQCRALEDKNGNITGTLSSALDITDRIVALNVIKESKERFDLAMKASKDGLFDWNLVTNEIYYSPGWKSMLGYTDDELPNDFSIWENLTEPGHVKKSWEMQQEVINKKRDRFEMEFKMKHKDGHWVDILSRAEAVFDENGKAIRMVGTHVDMTERIRQEIKILESEKKYHNLINLAQEGIWVIDKNNLTTYVNPSMAKMLKYAPEEMIGESLFDFMDENGVRIANENLEHRQVGVKEQHDFEFICKNGDRIFCTLAAAPIIDASGNYEGLIAGVIDITERNMAEKNIKKLNEELEDKVIERTKKLEDKVKELARMNKLFVGRELRMKDLKQMIKELEEKLEDK